MTQPVAMLAGRNSNVMDHFGYALEELPIKEEASNDFMSSVGHFDYRAFDRLFAEIQHPHDATPLYPTDELSAASAVSQVPAWTHVNPAALSGVDLRPSLMALSLDTNLLQSPTSVSPHAINPSLYADGDQYASDELLSPIEPEPKQGAKRRAKHVAPTGAVRKEEGQSSKGTSKRRKKSAAEGRRSSQVSSDAAMLYSPVEDLDDDGSQSEGKREKFLERNRVAASKCRQKKKEWIGQLEERLRELTAEQTQLNAARDMLKFDLLNLKNQLLQHVNCNCVGIRQYLAQTIARQAPHRSVYQLADGEHAARNEVGSESTHSSYSGSHHSVKGHSPPETGPALANMDMWHSADCSSQRVGAGTGRAPLVSRQRSTDSSSMGTPSALADGEENVSWEA